MAATTAWCLFPFTHHSEEPDIRRFASTVKAVPPADARIVLSEIGAFGFHVDRYVIDTLGLVDRETFA